MSGRNFSLKEMETVSGFSSPISKICSVRKELLSERDGNVFGLIPTIFANSLSQEGTSL